MPNPTVTIDGRLTKDPEIRFTANGTPVANFSIATSDRRKTDAGEWEDRDTSFWDCSAWRDLAEAAAETLTKGDRVHVTGTLKQRSFETRDGSKRTVVEVDVRAIGKDITPRRNTPSSSAPRGGGGWQAAQQQAPAHDPWAAQPTTTDEPPF